MDSAIDIDVFKRRLSETVAWCFKRINPEEPAHCLRSIDLRPPGVLMCPRFNIEIHEIVQAVVDERAHWIHTWHKNFDKFPAGLAGGRLLICSSATESIPDGGVTELSKGFYDEDDMPPWDTWLCYLENDVHSHLGHIYQRQYLVSWVPPQFIELANIGVEGHFLDCMHWATQADTPFTRKLKTAGLLG
jgi:hypothetical protein